VFFGHGRAVGSRVHRGRACRLRAGALICRNSFSHTADCGADRAPGLVFRDWLGQNQLCAQAKSRGETGAAIDNRDGDRVVAVFSPAANVKNQLGGRQIFAIDQHQVEALRIELLGSRHSVQGALAGY
jgi:hypothetical protein